jgi:hypothetical protein
MSIKGVGSCTGLLTPYAALYALMENDLESLLEILRTQSYIMRRVWLNTGIME